MADKPAYLSERHYEILRWLEVNPHHTSEVLKCGTPQERRLISGPYGSITISRDAWDYVKDFLGRAEDPNRIFGVTAAGDAAMRAREAAAQRRAAAATQGEAP